MGKTVADLRAEVSLAAAVRNDALELVRARSLRADRLTEEAVVDTLAVSFLLSGLFPEGK